LPRPISTICCCQEWSQQSDRANLDEQAGFTLVAQLPGGFPHEVNQEPKFGETWDIGPVLSLRFPRTSIRANVCEPMGTSALPYGLMLHGYWSVRFPFFLYTFSSDRLYAIRRADDWFSLMSTQAMQAASK
jgi:hypothetical protein